MSARLIPDDALAALTLWMEARGEGWVGLVAVAEVIRTRMRTRYASDGTVAGTVLRDRQFSCWNGGDPQRIVAVQLTADDPVYQRCLEAWQTACEGLTDYSRGADHYYAPASVDRVPFWHRDDKVVAEIEGHLFLKLREGT